jgi:hypothetical protein
MYYTLLLFDRNEKFSSKWNREIGTRKCFRESQHPFESSCVELVNEKMVTPPQLLIAIIKASVSLLMYKLYHLAFVALPSAPS